MHAQSATPSTTDLQLHQFKPQIAPELAAQSASISDLSVDASGMSRLASSQMAALQREKGSRTTAQRKIDSNVLYTERMLQGMNAAPGVTSLDTGVTLDGNNNIVVDMVANVNESLLSKLSAAGATVLYSNAPMHSIRALIAPNKIEGIAALPDVLFINPMQRASHSGRNIHPIQSVGSKLNIEPGFATRAARVRAMILDWQKTHGENTVGTPVLGQGSVETEGDITHGTAEARGIFGINGTGLKIGVLSDGVTSAAQSQALGDLPPTCGTPPCLTVLSGQAGSGDEGTAMLEIIHDMVPGASLYFATADNGGLPGFAANIQALRSAGCNIIVDDVFYFIESPFQDGQASTVASTTQGGAATQAVNNVVADGAFYFSSAGNEGNLDDGTSGTFEGDFVPMAAAAPLPSGNVHNFGSGNGYDTITAPGDQVASLFWTDPLGASANDYDLYLLDSTGSSILAASTNIQNGTQDPEEEISSANLTNSNRLVVFQNTGAQNRFFHLVIFRGELAVATNGETHGHSASSGAYTVAATPAAATFGPPTPNGPYPGLFTSASQTEPFSSDGLRHNFFNADSSAITPGNFSSTGGTILNKPEITAADGVSVTGVGGFDNPFYGTSAAAPAAASVAALVLAAKPTITPAQMKTALTSTAIDIMNTGFDRDSGNGIVMAVPAIESLGVTGSANPELGTVVATENPGNGNGTIERGEGALLSIPLQNTTGVMAATGITATLTSSTPGVTIMQPATSSYADLAVGAGAENNLTPFAFTLASNFPCAQVAQFTLTVSFSGGQTRTLNFGIQTGLISITNTLGSTPAVPAGITFATGTQSDRLDRNSVASSCSAPKAFPGTIAGTHSFDSYSFQSCSAQCFSPTLNAGAAGSNLLEALYSPSFDSTNLTTNYAGDPGSSTNIQDFSVSLIGNMDYSIVISDVAGNPPSGGTANTYTIQIPACAVSCNVNQPPVAIAQDVTVTAATYNGTASASINNGSYDPDGGSVTVTQFPAGPYPIGTTSVILTVTDPLGAFAQATANVTVNQPLLTPATLAETFGATSIPLGGTTSLSFALGNPNTTGSLSSVGFTDSLPSGLVIATPNGLSSTCGVGSFTAAAGSTSLSVSGVTLPVSSSCSISVNVNAIATGNQVDLTSAPTSLEGGAGVKATASLLVTQATPTVTVSPVSIVYGTSSTTLTASVAYTGPSAPTGTVTFQVDSGATVNASCSGSASPLTCTATYTTAALTAGPHIVKASLASDTNYNAASNTNTLSVTQTTPTVIVSNVSINYGAASTTFSASVAFAGAEPTGTFTFQVGSGAAVIASCSGTASPEICTASYTTSALTAGIIYTITGLLGADTNYGKASGTGTLILSKAPTTTALGNLPQTVNPNQTVTLNVAVMSTSPGTPSGTVSFYGNRVLLQTVTLINGSASYVTLFPAGATDTISAQYSGDTNFQSSQTSSVSTVIVLPLDFTLAPLSGMSSPFYIIPGNTATFSFQVTPLYGLFPGTVSFAINGLPNGVTYSFNPTSMAASSAGGIITGTLTASPTLLAEQKTRTNYAPILAALLLLPLAGTRRFRKRHALISVLLLGFAALSFVTGCGSSGDGILRQKEATYPLTLTVTSGNITHTVPFTLTVE